MSNVGIVPATGALISPQCTSANNDVAVMVILDSVQEDFDTDVNCTKVVDAVKTLKSKHPKQVNVGVQFYRDCSIKPEVARLDVMFASVCWGISLLAISPKIKVLFEVCSSLPLLHLGLMALAQKLGWTGCRTSIIEAEKEKILHTNPNTQPCVSNSAPLQKELFLSKMPRWKMVWVNCHGNQKVILRVDPKVASETIIESNEGENALPDFTFLDACGCASVKFLKYFKSKTKYLVASEEVISGDLPVVKIIQRALERPKTSMQLAETIIEEARNYSGINTLAVFDCSQIDPFLKAFEHLKNCLNQEKAQAKIGWAIHASSSCLPLLNGEDEQAGDVGDLMRNLRRLRHSLTADTMSAIYGVEQALSKLIVAKICRGKYKDLSGLSYDIQELLTFLGT